MFGLFVPMAAAEPWLDAPAEGARTCIRTQSLDAFLGDGRWQPEETAWKLGDADCPAAEPLRRGADLAVGVDPTVRLSGGDAVPDDLGGDVEPGLVTGVVGARGYARWRGLALRVEPEVEGGVVPGAAGAVRVDTVWASARWRGLELGGGRRERWMGPARHGALLLSDNARPPWMGTGTVEGRLPGWFDHLGRFRAEAGAGVLEEPRDDVANPGLLMTDLRWLPVPWIELGAGRLSIFGGEGRPPVDVGQLLLPTEPHVYDDPDQALPDQDELAALDARVTLPLRRWVPAIPVEYVEGWWQYGGEDVIGRRLGPIPYPSLAGVGNVYGGAVKAGPVVVTAEYSALLDDTFRWYVGHRVYHDGFTQGGRVMGNFGGPDSETMFGSAAWEAEKLRVRAWGDWTRRVGVIEAQNDKLFTFMTEERRVRVGADATFRLPKGGFLAAGYSFEHVTGDDFVPDAVADRHRVYVSLDPVRAFGMAR